MKKNRAGVWRLGIHLDIASRQWQEAMNKNAHNTKFNRPHWLALSAIDELGDNCNLTQICEYLKCEVSTCSRALAYLEENGFVTRDTLVDDKRAKGISMTLCGKDFLHELDCRAEVSRQRLLRDVTAEQLETFRYVIEKIKEHSHNILLKEKKHAGRADADEN